MRILGLDFGSKTVGVAMSDPLGLTAQGMETIERKEENKLRKTCARIEELVKLYSVQSIVLGYPKNMNNTEGDRAEKTKEFAGMIERRTGLPVILWDERLTTVAANQVLIENGVRRENRKAVIDKVAACLILQGYLDWQQMETEMETRTGQENGGIPGKNLESQGTEEPVGREAGSRDTGELPAKEE